MLHGSLVPCFVLLSRGSSLVWMSSVGLSIYLLVDVWVVSSAVTSSATCVDVEGTLIRETGAPGSVTHSLRAHPLPSLSLSVRF